MAERFIVFTDLLDYVHKKIAEVLPLLFPIKIYITKRFLVPHHQLHHLNQLPYFLDPQLSYP